MRLKDQTQEDNGKYATLGRGAVPNEAIVRHLHKTGYGMQQVRQPPAQRVLRKTLII